MVRRNRNSIEVKLSSSRDYPRHHASRFAPVPLFRGLDAPYLDVARSHRARRMSYIEQCIPYWKHAGVTYLGEIREAQTCPDSGR
jgi:hypothetical protein